MWEEKTKNRHDRGKEKRTKRVQEEGEGEV